jgi:hypothetical protein
MRSGVRSSTWWRTVGLLSRVKMKSSRVPLILGNILRRLGPVYIFVRDGAGYREDGRVYTRLRALG